uniref:Uncharacterized protein n=1 Tax=Anopheles coluzzii TaxID=1518534 RepID=A0A8W7P1Q1_ANOCL
LPFALSVAKKLSHFRDDLLQRHHRRAGRELGDEIFPLIAALCEARIERQLAQVRYLHLDAHLFGAASPGGEDARLGRALGAHERAHVLDHAHHRDGKLLAERYLLAHVEQRDLLRRRHQHCAPRTVRPLEEGRRGQMLVGRAGRRIQHQIVQLSPVDLGQELANHAVLLRPPPDDCIVRAAEQEADRHQAEIVLDVHRRPARTALVHLLAEHTEHAWLRRTADVDIEHAKVLVRVAVGHGTGEERRHCALAHATLAGQHQQLVAHVGQLLPDQCDGRIGPFRTGRTQLLIGAAGTRGRFARIVALCAGAVGWCIAWNVGTTAHCVKKGKARKTTQNRENSFFAARCVSLRTARQDVNKLCPKMNQLTAAVKCRRVKA